jgi:lipase
MAGVAYEAMEVPVDGGVLRVGRWGTGPDVVVGVHGLTLFHIGFRALADQLGDGVTLLAPDLRGRGGSATVGPPYGLGAHADDVAAVLHHLGAPVATIVGHSWGAAVALVTAQRHPDLVRHVVLVDGGIPHEPAPASERPAFNPVERVVTRLRTPFPSVAAYCETWRARPGLAAHWNPYVEELFRYELTGTPPELRSSLREDAFLADAASLTESDDATCALAELAHPATVVRAPRDMLDEPVPMYPEARVRRWQQRVPHLRDVEVPGVNHYTILFSEAGAHAVAAVIREELPCTTS